MEHHPAQLPQCSYEEFERRLILALGATVGGSALTKALGYRSQDAFRKALQRKRLPVCTFELVGRRGRFASAVDIANWLWDQRSQKSGEAGAGGSQPSFQGMSQTAE
ncbi:MAG: hypothetical protein Q8S02_18070 [Hydrogenophaga sp.]|nr:hypothetical protein [Hydrogenophaga sp.]